MGKRENGNGQYRQQELCVCVSCVEISYQSCTYVKCTGAQGLTQYFWRPDADRHLRDTCSTAEDTAYDNRSEPVLHCRHGRTV